MGELQSGKRRLQLAVAYDFASSPAIDIASTLRDICDIVWVIDGTDPALGPMAHLLSKFGVVIDTEGRPLAEIEPLFVGVHLDGVIAFVDTQLRTAGHIAALFGLDGNPSEVVDRLTDKYVQRRALADGGIVVPEFVKIPSGSTAEVAMELAEHLSFPVILKPLKGASSKDVQAFTSLKEFEAWFRSDAVENNALAVDFIAEEYLTDVVPIKDQEIGGYVSVETIVRDGVAVPLAVTGKFPLAPPFRESGNFMPHHLECAEVAAVLELANAAAAALGVQTGALHIEIKLTPFGPRIIEVNGRIGGGAIDPLSARRFGRSLTEMAALVALSQPVELIAEEPVAASGPFMYEFFAQPPMAAECLTSIGCPDDIIGVAGAQGVYPQRFPGDEVDWRVGSQGYVMRVGGEATDLAELRSVPTAVAAAARISYNEGTGS